MVRQDELKTGAHHMDPEALDPVADSDKVLEDATRVGGLGYV